MITFHGKKSQVSFVTIRKKGQPPRRLTAESDPKDLYAALYEFATTLNNLHEQAKQ